MDCSRCGKNLDMHSIIYDEGIKITLIPGSPHPMFKLELYCPRCHKLSHSQWLRGEDWIEDVCKKDVVVESPP